MLKIKKEEVYYDFSENHLTLKELSEIYNCSIENIYRIIGDYIGINRRKEIMRANCVWRCNNKD